MLNLIVILLGAGLVLLVTVRLAFRLGARSTPLAIGMSLLLIVVACLLFKVDQTAGEGAAAGVGIIWLAAWTLGGVCFMLAAALLLGSWRVNQSAVAACLLFLLLPVALYQISAIAGWQWPTLNNTESNSDSNQQGAGYAWAMDNLIASADECKQGNADFIAGCRKAVARMQAASAAGTSK